MPAQSFKIDQAATFTGMAFLSVEPKVKFGETEQERTSTGVPKWEVQLIAGFHGFGGKPTNEIMKVGVASHAKPAEGLAQYTPVELVDFELGVMDRKAKDGTVLGAQVWYRCSEVRSTAAVHGKKSYGD
jgi:hypothetical protein